MAPAKKKGREAMNKHDKTGRFQKTKSSQQPRTSSVNRRGAMCPLPNLALSVYLLVQKFDHCTTLDSLHLLAYGSCFGRMDSGYVMIVVSCNDSDEAVRSAMDSS